MTGFWFDLHITFRELVDVILGWRALRPVGVLGEVFSDDDRTRVWPGDSLRDCTDDELALINRFRLSLAVPEPSAVDRPRILADPDALQVLVGQRRDVGLRCAGISMLSDDDDAVRHWQKLRRNLQRNTRRGATVRNTWNGAEGRLPSHRWTAGAAELFVGGVPLVGSSDVLHYLLDTDDPGDRTKIVAIP